MRNLLIGLMTLSCAALGCGKGNEGSCERIAEACHELDTGSGKPHDCHEAAEAADATDDDCAKIEDECVAACK